MEVVANDAGDGVLATEVDVALDVVFFRAIFDGEIVAALTFADDDEFLLLKRFLPRKNCVVDFAGGSVAAVVSIGTIVGINDCCAIGVTDDVTFVNLLRCFFGIHFKTGFSDVFS